MELSIFQTIWNCHIYSNTTKYLPSPKDCLTITRCIDCIDVAVLVAYFGTLLVVAIQLWRLGKLCDEAAENPVGHSTDSTDAIALLVAWLVIYQSMLYESSQ